MSQFYDLASLVVIPSGYKASTIYAQKPLTTDGQLSFSRASTATRVNASGLIEAVASNVPRLDYLGSSCPRLLLEPQRTNLMLQSENLSASWSQIRSTATVNAAISPDGNATADKLIANTDANVTHFVIQTITSAAAGTYTYSAFFKKSEYDFGCVRISTNADTQRFTAVINLNNGQITATNSFGTPTGTSTMVQNYGNGWYRLIVTCAHTSGNILVVTTLSPTAVPTFTNGLPTFTGNGTSGLFTWGAQLELGAYPTSYVPTLSATVTRVGDAASKTGISSLIGQTEGTIFIDFVWNNSLGDVVPFDITGSDGKLIWMRGIGAQFYGNGSTLLADIGRPGAVQGTRYKIAFVYGQNDFRLYRNGSLIGTDTSGTFTGTFSNIALNSVINQANAFNQILLFKTKLTNAQLAELTTL